MFPPNFAAKNVPSPVDWASLAKQWATQQQQTNTAPGMPPSHEIRNGNGNIMTVPPRFVLPPPPPPPPPPPTQSSFQQPTMQPMMAPPMHQMPPHGPPGNMPQHEFYNNMNHPVMLQSMPPLPSQQHPPFQQRLPHQEPPPMHSHFHQPSFASPTVPPMHAPPMTRSPPPRPHAVIEYNHGNSQSLGPHPPQPQLFPSVSATGPLHPPPPPPAELPPRLPLPFQHQPHHPHLQHIHQQQPVIPEFGMHHPAALPPIINSGSAPIPATWHKEPHEQPADFSSFYEYHELQILNNHRHHGQGADQLPPPLLSSFSSDDLDKSGNEESAMMTAGGRKLPSWLKAEIEEMQAKKARNANRAEFERQREAYRQQNLEKLLSGGGGSIITSQNLDDEDSEKISGTASDTDREKLSEPEADVDDEEREENGQSMVKHVHKVSRFDSQYNAPTAVSAAASVSNIRRSNDSPEVVVDRQQELMAKIRNWMTDILLQVTNDEIATVSGEVLERAKQKRLGVIQNTASTRPVVQLVRKEGQERLRQNSVLVEYGSDDDDDSGDAKSADESNNDTNEHVVDSDEELKNSIASKLAAWPRKAHRYNAQAEGIELPPSPPPPPLVESPRLPPSMKSGSVDSPSTGSQSRDSFTKKSSEKKKKKKHHRGRSKDRSRSRSRSRDRSRHASKDNSIDGSRPSKKSRSSRSRSRSRSPRHKSEKHSSNKHENGNHKKDDDHKKDHHRHHNRHSPETELQRHHHHH